MSVPSDILPAYFSKYVVFSQHEPAKDYPVKISFNNGLVDVVRDKFGKDIMMIPDGEDNFTISATVRVSTEFYAWLFTFGRGAKILSLQNVADKMRDYAKNVYEMYKNDGEM